MNIAARNVGETGKAARLGFENVVHRYGADDVVRNVSLTANPGEVLCLLGPSGSGKSTLLRIAAGLEVPTRGRLLINGIEVSGPSVFLPPERRGVGLMFQDFALFPHMTVASNVAFGLTATPKPMRAQVVDNALARVGLSGYGEKYPHMLSGGEQQRVALARAVAPQPSVLLMDEPFSGLDSRLKDQVRAETLAVLRETGATVIIVTHDPEEAMGMADQIALLKDGELVQAGPPHMLFKQPVNLFAASFFSETNVLDVSVEAGKVDLPFATLTAPAGFSDGKATAAIRHSDVRLRNEGRGDAAKAHILQRLYLGRSEHFVLQIDGLIQPLHARISAGHIAENAESVFVEVANTAILLFEKRP